MRPQRVAVLLGLGIAASPTVTALINQNGPFALHIQGQAKNSSIDGYVHYVDLGPIYTLQPLQYEPMPSPPAGNVTYEFYFNYTGTIQTNEHEVGYVVTDPTYSNPVDPGAIFGKAMSLHYNPDSNVGFGVFGAGLATFLGFDSDNKTFISLDFTDSAFVSNERPILGERVNLYNWAVCWQFFDNIYIQALSWITYGPSHNPTCERVDLISVAI
ncbi:hypothetical protein F4678DRAFT_484127 [Xylaria arbuscula]|nr:hypothetical protein F4678DRAFT_484127 [Xylaria arbuscula]